MKNQLGMEKYDMEIPPEAKAKYLQRRKKDLADCQTALETLDYEIFIRIGHQLKGNATTFGFDPLATIGVRLEDFGKEKNLSEIRNAVRDFEVYLKSQNSPH